VQSRVPHLRDGFIDKVGIRAAREPLYFPDDGEGLNYFSHFQPGNRMSSPKTT